MNDQELIDQFAKCVEWKDADQWDALGMLYYQRGYILNAGECFRRADVCRDKPTVLVSADADVVTI